MKRYLSKFLNILPTPKINLIILVILFISISIIEALGIGLIGPFLHLANNPNLVDENEWSSRLVNFFDFSSPQQFVAILGVGIIALFIIKSILSWRIKTYVFGFCLRVRGKLCNNLMKAYLEAPYTFHLSKDSAHAIQTLNNYTKSFSLDILMPLLNSTANLMIIIALSLLLIITSVSTVVAILFLLLPLALLLNGFKHKIRHWGKKINSSDESIIRVVNYSLGGIKETKVIGCGPYFQNQLLEYTRDFEDAGTSLLAFQVLPRILVETILVIFLIGFTSILLFLNRNIQDIMPILGVFALASIRLLPAVSNLASGVSKLRSMSYVLDQLDYDLKEIETLKSKDSGISQGYTNLKVKNSDIEPGLNSTKINLKSEVILEEVTYQYPDTLEPAIENISLTINKGESVAFIGQSGAGKTTLVDIILGLLVPQSGDIKIDGNSVYNNLRSWQDLLGYIPQSIFLTGDTIERNIAFGVTDDLIDQDKLAKALEVAQLADLIQELPEGVKTLVGERGVRLSGGQRQRIGIARALYHGRDILVLDEATSALDNETESLVTESIQSLIGIKTMIVIAHRLTTIKNCDRVYVMEKGQIVRSGSYEEIVLNESTVNDE